MQPRRNTLPSTSFDILLFNFLLMSITRGTKPVQLFASQKETSESSEDDTSAEKAPSSDNKMAVDDDENPF